MVFAKIMSSITRFGAKARLKRFGAKLLFEELLAVLQRSRERRPQGTEGAVHRLPLYGTVYQ